jgi:Trk K+ transport system NAD-binding subunit
MLVVGGEHVGELVTEQLDARGERVVFIEKDPASVKRALDGGLTATEADLTDRQAFEDAELDDISTAFVASGSDSENLLIVRILAVRLDLDRIIVRMNDPRNRSAFENPDVETVCATNALAAALTEVTNGE